MKFRTLGSTGLRVSVITLGTWSMGGRWWGKTDDKASLATIRKALELGINFIDTADIYGFGHSESLLGQALQSRRDQAYIATKVGLRWNNKGKVRHDLSPAHIFKALDSSLERLQTDYIDLYQVHWPDPAVPAEETVAALNHCVQSGKVRFLGVSNFSTDLCDTYRQLGPFVTVQPPLNLFERHAEVRILPHAHTQDLGVLAYSPLCRGLLTGRFKVGDSIAESVRKRDPLFQGTSFERNLAVVAKLRGLAGEFEKSPAQLALAWVLNHAAVTTAICGARRPEQVEESVGAADWHLDEPSLKDVDQILSTVPC